MIASTCVCAICIDKWRRSPIRGRFGRGYGNDVEGSYHHGDGGGGYGADGGGHCGGDGGGGGGGD